MPYRFCRSFGIRARLRENPSIVLPLPGTFRVEELLGGHTVGRSAVVAARVTTRDGDYEQEAVGLSQADASPACALEDLDLMSQGEDLELQRGSRAHRPSNGSEH